MFLYIRIFVYYCIILQYILCKTVVCLLYYISLIIVILLPYRTIYSYSNLLFD